jgi:hypothetical protein
MGPRISEWQDAFYPLLRQLPIYDAVVTYLLCVQHIPQSTLGQLLGVTQAAISNTLKQSFHKLGVLSEISEVDPRPPLPLPMTLGQFQQDLKPFLTTKQLLTLEAYLKTTCQTDTAKVTGKSQGQVRYQLSNILVVLCQRVETLPHAHILGLLLGSPNLTREVLSDHSKRPRLD